MDGKCFTMNALCPVDWNVADEMRGTSAEARFLSLLLFQYFFAHSNNFGTLFMCAGHIQQMLQDSTNSIYSNQQIANNQIFTDQLP